MSRIIQFLAMVIFKYSSVKSFSIYIVSRYYQFCFIAVSNYSVYSCSQFSVHLDLIISCIYLVTECLSSDLVNH